MSTSMESVVSELSSRENSITSRCGMITSEDSIKLAFCKSAKSIAGTISRHEALLLPEVYRQFCESVVLASGSSNEIPTIRWFVSMIYHYFGNSIRFECKHRCFGTMKDCDILKALSSALGQHQKETKSYTSRSWTFSSLNG